jgi:hypothetical protein
VVHRPRMDKGFMGIHPLHPPLTLFPDAMARQSQFVKSLSWVTWPVRTCRTLSRLFPVPESPKTPSSSPPKWTWEPLLLK